MAAPAIAPPAPADAAAGIAGPDFSDTGAVGQLGKQAIAAEKAAPKALEGITGREGKALTGLEGQREALKPPEFKPVPPPTVESTNPQQVWGSSAMILAAIGSLFTRQPLTTAMNAAAQVVTAYRANDQNAANAAFQTWKIANENYNKAFEYQMDAYKVALGDLTNREDLVMKMSEAERGDVKATVDAYAHAFNDQVLIQQKGLEDQIRLLTFRDMHQQRGAKAAEANVEEHAFMQAWGQWQKDHPNAAPAEQMKAFGEIKASAMPSHTFTPSQAGATENRIASGVAKSDLGKGYSAAIRNYQTVEAFPQGGGVIPQAALQDAYTQLINGGRAIRGFQAKMNTEHAGLFDKVQIGLQQAIGHGGSLSPQMIADIKTLSKSILDERTAMFKGAVDQAKQAAASIGVDPDSTENLIYSQTGEPPGGRPQGGGAGDKSFTAATALLKQHAKDPVYLQSFDKHYGAGAAERVLAGS